MKKDLWQHIDTTMCTAASTSTASECPPRGGGESEELPLLAIGTGGVQPQHEALAFSTVLGDVSLKVG